jgi:hypothetical protein
MYEHCPLSPHNGINIASAYVLLCSPVEDNFEIFMESLLLLLLSSSSAAFNEPG